MDTEASTDQAPEAPRAPRMTLAEAAKYLGVDEPTVRRIVKANNIGREYDDARNAFTILEHTVHQMYEKWDDVVIPHQPPAGTYVSPKVAADEVGYTRQAVYVWARDGKVAVVDSGAKMKVRLEDVERIVGERAKARSVRYPGVTAS